MVEISAYSVERVKDPFGILSGERYEFFLDLEIDEEDELYTEAGVTARVLYKVEAENGTIVKCELLDRASEKPLDYDLEDDELEAVGAFCREHLSEAD